MDAVTNKIQIPLKELKPTFLRGIQDKYDFPSEGVVIEELDMQGGQFKLKEKCPRAVQDFLNSRQLWERYETLVNAIYNDKSTRVWMFGKWNETQLIEVINQYWNSHNSEDEDESEDTTPQVQIALCKREGNDGGHLWLEFIDRKIVPAYVPQFDITNFSNQIVMTALGHYKQLKFPNGVGIEKLKPNGRQLLKESRPQEVTTILEGNNKDLLEEYDNMIQQLIDECIEEGVIAPTGQTADVWNLERVQRLIKQKYRPMFLAKGNIDVYLCQKREIVYVTNVYTTWIEFVDRAQQPNYQPQREYGHYVESRNQ